MACHPNFKSQNNKKDDRHKAAGDSIEQSKTRKAHHFSFLFLIAGLWLIIKQPQTPNAFFNNPIVKNLAGYGGTLMGAIGIYFFSKKLLDKRPGLVIDENGIIDNTSAFSFGLISWSDVSAIYESSIQASVASKQRFITVEVNNPEWYMSRETNAIKKKLMMLNFKNYGSPIHITTNGLEIHHIDLLRLIKDRFDNHKAVLA